MSNDNLNNERGALLSPHTTNWPTGLRQRGVAPKSVSTKVNKLTEVRQASVARGANVTPAPPVITPVNPRLIPQMKNRVLGAFNPNPITSKSNIPWLMKYIEKGDIENVASLLRRGANPNIDCWEIQMKKDKIWQRCPMQARTPIELAKNMGNQEIVDMLVEKGAKLEIKDHPPFTYIKSLTDELWKPLRNEFEVSHGWEGQIGRNERAKESRERFIDLIQNGADPNGLNGEVIPLNVSRGQSRELRALYDMDHWLNGRERCVNFKHDKPNNSYEIHEFEMRDNFLTYYLPYMIRCGYIIPQYMKDDLKCAYLTPGLGGSLYDYSIVNKINPLAIELAKAGAILSDNGILASILSDDYVAKTMDKTWPRVNLLLKLGVNPDLIMRHALKSKSTRTIEYLREKGLGATEEERFKREEHQGGRRTTKKSRKSKGHKRHTRRR